MGTIHRKTLPNRAIPEPQAINTPLTSPYPLPTLAPKLTTRSTVVAPKPSPAPRVISDTVSDPRVSVSAQQKPPKIALYDNIKLVSYAQRKTSYKLC